MPRSASCRRRLDADQILNQPSPSWAAAHETQPFGTCVQMPIAPGREGVPPERREPQPGPGRHDHAARPVQEAPLAGGRPDLLQLHLLFDKHFEEQNELVDLIAERIQLLGGVSIAMAADVAEMTRIPRPPRGREEVPVQISRLLEAHEMILKEARTMARQAADGGDDGTNDLLVSDVIRTNELQAWFVAEHVVDTPVVRVDDAKTDAKVQDFRRLRSASADADGRAVEHAQAAGRRAFRPPVRPAELRADPEAVVDCDAHAAADVDDEAHAAWLSNWVRFGLVEE